MRDEELGRLYAAHVAARRAETRSDCPDPDAILAAVERRGPEGERLRTINHALECRECREELELIRGIQATRPRVVTRPAMWALAATIVLAVGLATWRLMSLGAGAADVTRGVTEGVTAVAPVGETHLDALRFVWRPVTGATAYELEIRRADGSLVARSTTSDTSVAPPAGNAFDANTDFYWSVVARLADASEARSTPRRFRIRTP